MAKGYLSNRQRNLKVGISSYTENNTVLEITGKVGIGTTNALDSLTVLGKIQVQQDSSSNNRIVLRGQPASSYRWNIDNYSSSNEFRIFREDDVTAANGSVAVSISTTGNLTATKFFGDGSSLTGIVAAGSGVVVQNQGSNVGTANTINFSTNLTASFSSGTATISLSNNPSISGILTADQVYTSNNGNGQNVRIGDDFWLGDVNVADTVRFSGAQDSTRAFIIFGSSDAVALGRTGTGPLYYGGNFNAAGVVTSNGFNATTGNDYKINGTSVLNSTTLGSGVTNSSLTSVGTLGSLNVSGITTLAGNIFLGDNTADDITVSGEFISNLIPDATNTYDLGSSTQKWRDVWSAGSVNANSFSGSGTNLTGIVTSIVAGNNITVSGSTGQVTINASGGGGSISIANTSVNDTYYIGIASTSTGTLTTLNVSTTGLTFNPSTGNLVAGGTVTANSDESLKTNIKTIENALDKVLSLRGVEFDRIDNGDHQIGVIAQEVEKIMPQVVYPKQPAPDYEKKSVAYANLIGLLIEAIKELNEKIESR